ncbi:MAG: adhesin, partial [Bacteroidetes bacterium CG_4_10_14_3_um_filter_31_20]
MSANCGANNGSATITANGGTPGYTYLWDAAAGNQTSITAVNLLPGTYQATVTDVNLCTFVVSATVSNLAGVVASISGTTPVSCNGGNNGTATASGTGGNMPYSYLWPVSAGSQTTATATNLSQGTYTVTITDLNGCTSTANATVNQPTVVTATISVFTNALCYSACNGTA